MMQTHKHRALALAAVVALATSACAGKDGAKGADGAAGTPGADGTSGTNGTNGSDGKNGVAGASTGLQLAVSGVTVNADSTVSVRFTAKDDRGYPVDLSGKTYSVNTQIKPRFSIAYVSKDSNGNVLPYTALSTSGTPAQPTAFDPSSANSGTLVENGTSAGDYTYTFPASVALDPTKASNTHVVWIQASRQTDVNNPYDSVTFTTVNQEYDFVPAGGTPLKREIASTAGCNACHAGFKPEIGGLYPGASNAPFHGGGRTQAAYCNMCHNPAHTSNPAADSLVFVHRIHNGENIQTANQFHGIAATYPQDIRNCDACHKGAAQGGQAYSRPSRAACASCHDAVDFTGTAAVACKESGFDVTAGTPIAGNSMGGSAQCAHRGGPQPDDTTCTGCHFPNKIQAYHVPVANPDPNNVLVGGTNANTNAAWLAGANAVPANAAQISYDVKTVGVTADGKNNPYIVFKLKSTVGGTTSDVVFNTFGSGKTELIDGFVGSPSVYFAYAESQDGITAPADFNAAASAYIKRIWNGTYAATTATLTGPDASTGYYTVTLTGTTIPAGTALLTGGVGYTYGLNKTDLTKDTQPLTEIDLTAYPYNPTTRVGGLIVPAADVTKVATGFSGRRAIVNNAACNNCHSFLGVAPTFHAGQRNDGPTCAFCHTANKTSYGWAANSKDFIHAIHGGRVRSNPFTWHAASPTDNYGDVGFPSALNNCQACHLPGTYDFSATAVVNKQTVPVYTDALMANLLWSTAAAGTFNGADTTQNFEFSPYVTADNTTSYGTVYSVNAAGVPTQATAATVVTSPITAACVACHDSSAAQAHMKGNGGSFYASRASLTPTGATSFTTAKATAVEQCLLCHGPGTMAPIGDVHGF